LPEVVVHASVSVDGAMTGFMPDLGAHYGAVAALGCDAHLIGSATMRAGLDMADEAPADPGAERDRPPTDRAGAPYWFVVDSRGVLHGRLHELRAFPGLRDVVVLLSSSSPQAYRDYLVRRQYGCIERGTQRVDLVAALDAMGQDYGVTRVLVDAGPTLTSVLLAQGLLDEVSLIVHPVVVGRDGRHVFGESAQSCALQLDSRDELENGLVHVRYTCAR
jgi:2,5-diamino-6-(ribosylamino)-4(3H)-pyrimidinone 5'-phosphate reductase